MHRLTEITPEYVELMPDTFDHGVLYISRKYKTAIHLCACGCGYEVVTPLRSDMWVLFPAHETVSLHPSIGNYGFPCQSHYFITDNKVRWL